MRPHTTAFGLACIGALALLWSIFMLYATWWEHDTVTYIQLLKQGWFWIQVAKIFGMLAVTLGGLHIYEATRKGVQSDGTDNRRHYNPSTAPDRCACGKFIPKGSCYCTKCIPY